MPRHPVRPPGKKITTPAVLVEHVNLQETERIVQVEGRKKTFIDFAGGLVLNGKALPLAVRLISDDGSVPVNRGTFYVSVEVNKDEEATNITLAVLFPNESKGKNVQHECPVCSGNRGRSGPIYDGLAADSIGAAVLAYLRAKGFKTATEDRPGGCRVTVCGDRAQELPHGKPVGFYSAYRTRFDCPVHGIIEPTEYEPNC